MLFLRYVIIICVLISIPNAYNIAALYNISLIISTYEDKHNWVTQQQLYSGFNVLKHRMSMTTISYSIVTCILGLVLSLIFAIVPEAISSDAVVVNILMLALLMHFTAVVVTATSTLYIQYLVCNAKIHNPPTVIGIVIPQGVVVSV